MFHYCRNGLPQIKRIPVEDAYNNPYDPDKLSSVQNQLVFSNPIMAFTSVSTTLRFPEG